MRVTDSSDMDGAIMIINDHSKVRYIKMHTTFGMAYLVKKDKTLVGFVMHGPKYWRYLLVGNDSDTQWKGGYLTRKEAADHLLSAFSPSAAWLI